MQKSGRFGTHCSWTMYSIQLLSRIDLITSAVGALICILFVYNEGLNPDRLTPFPWEQTIGMAFNALLCPVCMYWNFDFYQRWRTVIISVLRVSFIIGTVADYDDIPQKLLRWPGFLINLLYSSRSLVIGWGCFGWLLPLKYHIWMQGIHSVLALRLAPEICRKSNSTDSFASLNMSKFQTLMHILDWPFSSLSDVYNILPSSLTNEYAACIGVSTWMTIFVGFLLPIFVIISMYPGLSTWTRTFIQRDGVFILLIVGQMLWIFLRMATMHVM